MQETLQYTSAALLLDRMGAQDLLQVTTEGEEISDATETLLSRAIDYADGAAPSAPPLAEKIARLVRRALAHGEGRVNSKVGTRYPLPAYAQDGTVPSEIEDACLTLAEARLRGRRESARRYGSGESGEMASRVDEVEKWLDDVARGNAIIAKLNAQATEQDKPSSSDFGFGSNSRFTIGW